jgi:hypothetical protein
MPKDQPNPLNPPRLRSILWTNFIIRPFFPATAATQSQDLPLRTCWLIHAFATFFAFAAVVTIPLAVRTVWRPYWTVNERRFGPWDQWVRHHTGIDWGTVVNAAVPVVAIELYFLLAALLVTPWGARNERIRSSFASALRQTWLHTTHAFAALTICLVWVGIADHAFGRWSWRVGPMWWSPWYVLMRTAPWIIAWGWLLWALLRVVAAERHVQTPPRDPTCESCGYNLTGTPRDGRCSECGASVEASLGESVRRGCEWDRSQPPRKHPVWLRTTLAGLRSPRQFARTLSIATNATDYRSYLARNLFRIFTIAMVGFVIASFTKPGWYFYDRGAMGLAYLVPALSAGATLAALVLVLSSALIAGWFLSIRSKRSLLPAAMQVAAYQSSLLIAWALFAVVARVVLIDVSQAAWFLDLVGWHSRSRETILSLGWWIPNIVFLTAYIIRVAQGTAAMRYANR